MTVSSGRAFCVSVRHNLVCRVEAVVPAAGVAVPDAKLEVGTQLARNHREQGCLDGDYYFPDGPAAVQFALLCQDFMRRLVDRTTEDLQRAGIDTEKPWRNPFSPSM